MAPSALPRETRQYLFEAFRNNPYLAFFALAVLVIESILLVLAGKTAGTPQLILVLGLVVGLGGLILAVYKLASATVNQIPPKVSRPAAPGLLQSDEALIEVVFERNGQVLQNARVRAVSSLAKQFFGFAPNARIDQLVGRSADDLMLQLCPYINPPAPHWKDLGEDQRMVFERLSMGRRAYAHVPVHFNAEHPFFPNKAFLPLIVERGEFEEDGKEKEFRKAVYIDVTAIPTHLFREQAWYEVTRTMAVDDRAHLADDLHGIAGVWKRRGESQELKEQIAAVEEAERLLRDSGGAEVIRCCAEAGWFALWETAKHQEYRTALRFLGEVAGIAKEAA